MCVPRPRDGVCALHTRRACVKYPCHLPMADTAQLAHALAMHALHAAILRASREVCMSSPAPSIHALRPHSTVTVARLAFALSHRPPLSESDSLTRSLSLTHCHDQTSTPHGACHVLIAAQSRFRYSRPLLASVASVSSTLSSLASARRPRSVCRAFHAACGVCHAHW